MNATSLDEKVAQQVTAYLADAQQVILPAGQFRQPVREVPDQEDLYVGVDLGTAYIVLVAVDSRQRPVYGEYRFAEVVRDGLVVDYFGAVNILQDLKKRAEEFLGRTLSHAATGFPPGVPRVEVRATANVVEAAGFTCTGLVDEPTAANNILQMRNTAIVDVGGGTTGIAVVKDGEIVYTADEATGGTHFTLTIAGALDISFEEAEALKIQETEQGRLFPVVRPVMEKVGSIIQKHTAAYQVDNLTLVGGTSSFHRIDEVVSEYTGLPVQIPLAPMLVTPLGISVQDLIFSRRI